MESDSLRHYVTNFIGTSGNNDVTGDEIIHGYVAFCDSEGWATNSTRQIQNELPDLMLEIHRAKRRQDIKRGGLAQRGYAGVALREFAAAA
jgi:hypothetical protein